MKSKVLIVALLTTLLSASASLAQNEDIEIIDKNGKQVGQHQIQIAVDNAAGDNAAVDKAQATTAKIEGDRIIIVDQDGTKREIDISNAAGVSVEQSVKSVNNNGEQKTVKTSRAIIIGPDGEKQIIELDGPIDGAMAMPNLPRMQMEFFGGADMPEGLQVFRNGLPGAFSTRSSTAGKYMIGVFCEPVSDQLRAHLDLSDDVGLIIKSVGDDSPASDAGLQKHDILIFADDKELTSLKVLSEVVEGAGKDETEISLSAIRNGKEISFNIRPTERPVAEQGNMMVVPDFQFRQLGPGVIADGEFMGENFGGMRKEMEEMRKQVQEMQKLMRQRMGDRLSTPRQDDQQ